jgi:hypothetical protein
METPDRPDSNDTLPTGDSAQTPAAVPRLEITTSRQFPAWLAEQKLSLALTTYQIGKLFFIGLKDERRTVDLRAQLQPLHGAVRDGQRPVPEQPVPGLALREPVYPG